MQSRELGNKRCNISTFYKTLPVATGFYLQVVKAPRSEGVQLHIHVSTVICVTVLSSCHSRHISSTTNADNLFHLIELLVENGYGSNQTMDSTRLKLRLLQVSEESIFG